MFPPCTVFVYFVDGVIIVVVSTGSAADKSGLKSGDVILTVNGQDVNKPSDIRTVILESDLRSGDQVAVKVFRNGGYKNSVIKLGRYKGNQSK